MTPAEKPKAKDKNFVFVLEAKNAVAPPIPVASPAINVSPIAIKMFSVMLFSPAYSQNPIIVFWLLFGFLIKLFLWFSLNICAYFKKFRTVKILTESKISRNEIIKKVPLP